MEKNLDEVWEKMNQQDHLRMRLQNAIPDMLIIDQWKAYILFLKKSLVLLDETLNKIAFQNFSRVEREKALITTEKEARYHLFNFYSCAYCIRQTMYEGKHFSKGADKFDLLVTEWKKEAIPKIAIAIRNKYQHGSLMEHILTYNFTTKHAPQGEGMSVYYNFESETWDKIKEELNQADKAYLDSIFKSYSMNPVAQINKEFVVSCEGIADKIQNLFNSVYDDDFFQHAEIKKEFDAIEQWFSERGMYSV